MFLHLAAAALAGSRLRVCNVLFVVVRRYYVSSWICSRSHGTDDSASSSKPPYASALSFPSSLAFILTGKMSSANLRKCNPSTVQDISLTHTACIHH